MSTFVEHPLLRGDLASADDVCCRPSDSAVSPEAHTTAHRLIFVRRGVCVIHRGRERTAAAPASVVFCNLGEPYRVSHPVPGGDDCSSFAFPAGLLGDALERYDPSAADRPHAPFRTFHAIVSPATIMRLHRLHNSLAAGGAGRFEAEEETLGLLARTLHDVHGAVAPAPMDRAARERVEATREIIVRRPGDELPLAALARAVDSSPFHLARLFARIVGSPIHRYRTRVRLAVALDRLSGGEADLTRLALDLGFSSHSHFTTVFRGAFGVVPSEWRRAARARI
jgi:AraC family transcriptional regulator